MKIVVDHAKCDGYAVCEIHAPTVFEVRDDNLAHVACEHPPPELLEAVKAAVRGCPAQAITLEDDET